MPAHDSSRCEWIDQLAEEFAARYRRGERPSLQEYVEKYPELADDIRRLFPTLVEMEQLKKPCGEAASPALVQSPALRQVGDYRILREMGRGGMGGIVYEAEQVPLGRRVALKVLPPHIAADYPTLERFRREARSAAKLHHTNIVPVFDVGRDGDTFYYAMQLIQGQGLDQIVEELLLLRDRQRRESRRWPSDLDETQWGGTVRPDADRLAQSLLTGCFHIEREAAEVTETSQPSLPAAPSSAVLPGQAELSSVRSNCPHYFRSVARLGYQIATALAYAHARGIIHRDIKPSNLLLDAAGVVWITDFGLAKTQENSLTNTGDIVGTLRYMAPERFQGNCDERADLYGLGLTLYEMLVLRPAFDSRDRLRLIDEIKNSDPPRPRSMDHRISGDLETIVLKSIHKEAKQRYQSADDMAEDLRRFLADEPIKARRASRLTKLRLWGRRNPAVASLMATVFLLLLSLTLVSVAAAFYLKKKSDALAEAEEDRTEKLYQSLVAQANASRHSRQVGQRFITLDAVRRAVDLVRERHMPEERLNELRNLAIGALMLPDFRTLRTLEAFPGGTSCWGSDDQLRRYARGDLEGNISLRWIDTGEEIARLEGWRHDFWLGFSPGGRFLLANDEHRFRVWDLSVSPPLQVLEGENHNYTFHPDGRHLLMGQGSGSMSLHDLADAQQKPLVLMARQSPYAFDPAGNRLAAFDAGKVYILDAKTGKELSSIPEAGLAVAWHPSGNYLALVCAAHEIHVWDLIRSKRMSVLKGWHNGGLHLAFTPDGERLLSNGWENVTRVWDWRTGRQLLQMKGRSSLCCRADGRLLASEGSRLSLIELTTGREFRSLVQQSNAGNDVDYWGICVHPGGRLAVAAMADAARLFDLDTGEEVAALPAPGFGNLFQGKDALLTNGTAGLFRWPIQVDRVKPNRWRIGPPKQLHYGTKSVINCDKRGEIIGQSMRLGANVVRPGKGTTFLGPQPDTRCVAISPDGKYAATGSHLGDEGIGVWDTETGRLLHRIPVGGMAQAAFSPNGEWLEVVGSRCRRLLKVGTWEERPLPTYGIFSPDGYLLAAEAETETGAIRLIMFTTNREIARLDNPNPGRIGLPAFTPDGSKVLHPGDDNAYHLWDLRAIRAQLVEIGLDWDAPPLPPAPPPASESLQIDVDLGDYRQMEEAAALVRQAASQILSKKEIDGLATLNKAVRIAPNHAMAHNNLAWLLLTGPKKLRDPVRAEAEARRAIALEDYQSIYHNTLGVALYRNGKFAEAVLELERALRKGKGQADSFDLFFLAMCHHRLGDADKAKDYRARAVEWFAKNKAHLTTNGWIEELTAFQAEAETVLAQPSDRAKK